MYDNEKKEGDLQPPTTVTRSICSIFVPVSVIVPIANIFLYMCAHRALITMN